jgi:2,4-dienoyl-CoA reductase-like NADH-dependent reductase (Old Yellow Enzyme family)
MHILEKAEPALIEGHADFAAIDKAAPADPHWPNKISEGRRVRLFHRDMLWPEATISQSSKISDRLDQQIQY